MSKILTDTAIVIKRSDYGERDKLITLFTQQNGKLTLIAKGVRSITSRRKGHLELFTQLQVSFTESEGLGILTEADAEYVPTVLEHDWSRLGQVYHVCEIVDRLLPEREQNEYTYRLLSRAIHVLHDEDDHVKREQVVRLFEKSLLQNLGYWDDSMEFSTESPALQRQLHQSIIEQIIERGLKANVVFR